MPNKRKGSRYWWVRIGGVRQSSETEDFEAATRVERDGNEIIQLSRQKAKIEAMRLELVGAKPARSWKELCVRWSKEKAAKASWLDDLRMIEWWGQHLDQATDIRMITRERVDDIVREHRSGVSVQMAVPANSTANRYVALLTGMLNAACKRWDWIERAPLLMRYPEPEGRDSWLTVAKWRVLEQQCPEHLRRPATFALATGLRDAKVFRLEWPQINMQERYLMHKGTGNKLGNVIPLNETAIAVLREIQASPVRHMTRVFTWMKPKKLDDVLTYTIEPLNDYGKAWWKALARAGLGHYDADGHWQGEFTWHGLRHTFATWLRGGGAPDWAIDALGGWSRAATRERYSHVHVEGLRPFAQIIDTLLTQQPDVRAAQQR